MNDTGYQCKECGTSAVVTDGIVIRSCEHTGTVIVLMEATVTANGTVDNGIAQEPRPTFG